ncbi:MULTISPECIES: apotyrosinase chaperone MelC1 [Streptomyces]|uniref:apotyrosinase chaperone MelC1 n=1 Tax=Streptomyces TaxID=1883 RepID=UPI00292F6F1C|nr:tyrosinase cofactor [Streptomyces sp. NEAU-HV9]
MLRITRRDMVRGATLAVAGSVLAAPAAAAATALRPPGPHGSRHRGADTTHIAQANATRAHSDSVPERFDEMYLGRHIEGWPAEEDGGGHHHGQTPLETQESTEFVVRVDDEELHVMQNADGTWISVVNHYETHRTPRDAARAAVRELHGASLVPLTV